MFIIKVIVVVVVALGSLAITGGGAPVEGNTAGQHDHQFPSATIGSLTHAHY